MSLRLFYGAFIIVIAISVYGIYLVAVEPRNPLGDQLQYVLYIFGAVFFTYRFLRFLGWVFLGLPPFKWTVNGQEYDDEN